MAASRGAKGRSVHWRMVLARAWRDTRQFFDWSPKQLVWPALVGVGALLHLQWADTGEPVNEELMLWATYTLAPVGAFALLLFAWNLVRAPYKLIRERAEDAERQLELHRPRQSVERIESQQTFPLWEAASMLAGVPASRDPVGEASAYMHRLKVQLVEDSYGGRGKMRRFRGAERLMATEVDQISDSYEITRARLRAYAEAQNIEIEGLTDGRRQR